MSFLRGMDGGGIGCVLELVWFRRRFVPGSKVFGEFRVW